MISGSPKAQVRYLSSFIDNIGESKHKAKEQIREELGTGDWHLTGKGLGIHSYSTMYAYRDVWRQCFTYAKQEYGIKSIEQITGEHVQSFLEHKIEEGVAYSTFQNYASALEKLEVALNKYYEETYKKEPEYEYQLEPDIEPEIEQEPEIEIEPDIEDTEVEKAYDFESYIDEAREVARVELAPEYELEPRAYNQADAIIDEIFDEMLRTTAEMQYESGARVSEVSYIEEDQLKGYGYDPIYDREVGIIEVSGKGGKVRELYVSPENYETVKQTIEEKGVWKVDYDEYRNTLKEACERAGEEYHGTHGLRHNFAQERVEAYQEKGYDYYDALAEVSKEMGHERADITERYLR